MIGWAQLCSACQPQGCIPIRPHTLYIINHLLPFDPWAVLSLCPQIVSPSDCAVWTQWSKDSLGVWPSMTANRSIRHVAKLSYPVWWCRLLMWCYHRCRMNQVLNLQEYVRSETTETSFSVKPYWTQFLIIKSFRDKWQDLLAIQIVEVILEVNWTCSCIIIIYWMQWISQSSRCLSSLDYTNLNHWILIWRYGLSRRRCIWCKLVLS